MSKKLLLVTKMYDENYNIFKFDTTKTYGNKTVVLSTNRKGDNTPWDTFTDWGDGVIDTNTSHTYTNDGIYLVKTKYVLDESGSGNNNTKKKLIDCININKNIKDWNNLFRNCINVVEFTNSSNWNTTNVTNMSGIFNNCINLTALDVSNWNTTNVTNMDWMFTSCNNLTALDVSNFNTDKVTNMNNMFGWCNKLTTLDVSNFNTNNVTDMSNMFRNCNKLTTLDISNFNMDNVTTYENMFLNCTSLHQSGLTMTNCNEATKTKINAMIQV